MKNITLLIGFATVVTFSSCHKDSEKKANPKEEKSSIEKAGHTQGEITFVADPTYKNIVDAWVATYTNDYPKVKIKVDYQVEDLAVKNFYEGKYPIAIVGKELDEAQKSYLFNKTTIKYAPSPIALDATILITSIDNPIDSISENTLKNDIYKETNKYVFDRANSSNFNTINTKLNTKVPTGQKVTSIEDFDQMIEFLQKSKNAVGVIGYNVLSDKDSKKVQEYLTKIKILKLVNKESKTVEPSLENFRNGSYPFTRFVYILKNEKGFGIGAGFTRFAGSQQGQLIVKKEEMQPYYLYKREIILNSNPI